MSTSALPGERPPTLEQVCAAARKLPSAPALLPRLVNVLQDTTSGADEIAALIQLDQALTASTLRAANSVALGGAQPVATIAEAVLRLGLREVFRLAALALMHRWEGAMWRNTYGTEPGDHCRHALCTALAASVLAELMESADPQVAYTAGLVCDLGKLALAQSGERFFPTIYVHRARRGGTWVDAEQAVLGYSYLQVTAQLLRTWKFPDAFLVVAEHWQSPPRAPEAQRAFVALLHAAKHVAAALGPGVGEDGFLFELQSDCLCEHGFTPELLEATLPIVVEQASNMLQEKLTVGALVM